MNQWEYWYITILFMIINPGELLIGVLLVYLLWQQRNIPPDMGAGEQEIGKCRGLGRGNQLFRSQALCPIELRGRFSTVFNAYIPSFWCFFGPFSPENRGFGLQPLQSLLSFQRLRHTFGIQPARRKGSGTTHLQQGYYTLTPPYSSGFADKIPFIRSAASRSTPGSRWE